MAEDGPLPNAGGEHPREHADALAPSDPPALPPSERIAVMVSDIVRESRRQGKEPPRFGLLRLGTGNALAWVIGASQVKRGGLQVDIERLRGDAGSRPVRLIEVEEY